MVSSAKSLTLEVKFDWRSLMYKRKSPGPNNEPWGTLAASDETPSSTTVYCLSSNQFWIHLVVFPSIP